MTQLCVQSGWLLKRNEQRVWQPRYCVTVPKTYLYYFETEDALQPRGIIDLEWYTDIATEQSDNSLIVLSPGKFYIYCMHAVYSCDALPVELYVPS